MKPQAILFPLLFILFACTEKSPDSSAASNGEAPSATAEKAVSETDLSPRQGAPDTEAAIAVIQAGYKAIRQELGGGQLREDLIEYECDSGPGSGTLERHYRGEELVLIEHAEGGEHFWTEVEIYLKGGEPFFVLEKEGSWMFGGPMEDGEPHTVDRHVERRYYLQEGTLIRELHKEWEEESWVEKSVTGDQVPNETVALEPGAAYPGADTIDDLAEGKVGC